MPKIIKNTMLNYLPDSFAKEYEVHYARVHEVNASEIKDGDIVYLTQRELRVSDNFSLNFAKEKAKELNKNLKIIHLKQFFETDAKQKFYEKQLRELQLNYAGYDFEIRNDLSNLNPGVVICDFNPIADTNYGDRFECKVFEVDAHNIVPIRFATDKQEYNASTIRRKIYRNIFEFLTEFPESGPANTDAREALEDFILNKLDYYQEYKNNYKKDVTSGLSGFLNPGFISVQRVALEIIKADTNKENKESFLEELIVRAELSDNFCLYCDDYKTFKCIPAWAKETLFVHRHDTRAHIYTKGEFEYAKTRDDLWNISQMQLINNGKIHGYLRMYWAKKILEWTRCPEDALEIAIYLNDKYACDAPSPNGYTGILWSIGGLHDRAFMERPVIGKIRPMNGKLH